MPMALAAIRSSRFVARGASLLAVALAAALTLAPARAAGPADAETAALCAKARTVERWNTGEGFTYFPTSGDRLFAMSLPGKHFTPHRDLSRPAMQIDGVFYQFLFVPISAFSPGPRPSDAELLSRHARWEFDAARRAGGPLDRFADLGNKDRPATDGREAATFKLWRMHNADDTATQFFVTTIVGDEVVVMSAIPRPDPAAAEQFGKVFRYYADKLVWLECRDAC